VNIVGVFLFIYENRRMKSVEIVLRKGGRRRRMEGRIYLVSTYVNITMYPPVQLLYANKKSVSLMCITLSVLYFSVHRTHVMPLLENKKFLEFFILVVFSNVIKKKELSRL
jgi:hypothetical protein